MITYFDSMNKARKGYARVLEPICRQWDLTRNELDILLFLFNNPGLDRAADIVSRRGIAKSHVSMSVAALEGRGLLIRQTEESDRRTVHLKLAARAVPMAQQARDAQRDFFTRIFDGLSPEEIELWQTIVMKVQNNIESMEELQ